MSKNKASRDRMNTVLMVVAALSVGASLSANATEHHQACSDNIQSKIAWNDAGDKFWQSENLEKLCASSTKPVEPGLCFKRVMTERVSWGLGDSWKWENAINLCAGTDNAEERISCFKSRIDAKEKWQEAIFQCQRSGKAAS